MNLQLWCNLLKWSNIKKNVVLFLFKQLQDTALDQAQELIKYFEDVDILSYLKTSAHAGDQERMEEYAEKFTEYAEHVQDVRKYY